LAAALQMVIDAARFQKLLSDFELGQLFNELGWDHAQRPPQEVDIDRETYRLTAIAQKRGVVVFLYTPDAKGLILAHPVRLKIEKEATKLAHEHLLIFTDAERTALTWL